ncbi:hypothetical protein HNR44_000512 [Geomicrobium halophilum]|uniref:Uncharacterized protein n=1 Tax=Geomicrobium halophilum TaxID=549000 RepID=A0A841PW96_9BACL|nr:hypothetical protein [Geomicrobium halophilum]
MVNLSQLTRRFSIFVGIYFTAYFLYSGQLYIYVINIPIPTLFIIGMSFLNAWGLPVIKKLAAMD